MGDNSFLKSALIFLSAALVILIFMPKECAKNATAPITALRRAKQPAATKGLHIDSSTPAPNARAVTYPAGLDAARLQYLIEIESHFAAPLVLSCPKRPGGAGNSELATAMQTMHYIEVQPDGSFALTREGTLHADTTDNGTSWGVQVARRQFVRTDAIDCSAADQCSVTFSWQWQPNEVGQAMGPSGTTYSGTAHIVGGTGGWVVSGVYGIDAGL